MVKRKAKVSYTQKTLKALRELGYHVDICEKFNPHAGPFGIRQDLFGFMDIIAFNEDEVIAVQSTGPSGHAEHKRKILANEFAKDWVAGGRKLELWSWRKLLKNRGGKLRTWQPRIEEITLLTFQTSCKSGATEQPDRQSQ